MSDAKHEAFIAGVKFRPGAEGRLQSLADGALLTLDPEPDNQYDPDAVRVLHEGFHLGYVPRELSAEVATLIKHRRIGPCVKRSGNRMDIHFDGER